MDSSTIPSGATLSLDASPASPRTARRFVNLYLAGLDREVRGVAELLSSELATNATIHTNSPFAVTVSNHTRVVRVGVRDASSDEPPGPFPETTAPDGRGLLLVTVLADRWGIDRAADGKTVWFELDVDSRGLDDADEPLNPAR